MRRAAASAGVGLLVALAAGPGSAQPLLPNSPLTTLMQPQRLDRSRPLLPQERAATSRAPGQAGTGANPCERRSGPATDGSARPQPGSPSRASGGGAGPGEYARFLPGAAPSTGTGGDKASPAAARPAEGSAASAVGARAPGADRPLYGGTDRPLWSTGAPRAGVASAKPSTEAGADASTTGPASSGASTPALPRDRPLWADGSEPAEPSTRADSAVGSDPGLALLPCTAPSGPLVR